MLGAFQVTRRRVRDIDRSMIMWEQKNLRKKKHICCCQDSRPALVAPCLAAVCGYDQERSLRREGSQRNRRSVYPGATEIVDGSD
jgi:hypothetical protein